MLKNTAGQKIGAQLVALDGVAFTGSVTVYVCGDAGTQAAGSVGGGACTHEGNGYHTYAPSQAETNYDLIAFTFVGTNASTQTVIEYTFPPMKNRAGQYVGAQLMNTDGVAFTGAVTAYVCGDAGTQAIGSVGAGACTHKGNGYHVYTPSQAETNYDLVAFTLIGTGAVPANVQWDMSAERWTPAGQRAASGLASANLDTQLSTIAGYLDTEVAAIKAKTDNLPVDTNTLLTSTGIKIASIANGAIAAATFAAGALDAVWSTATRTLTAISDSSGITTLLGRIIGTLATGTHQPQSGDTYARLGAPAGASVSADLAAIDAAVSGLHDFDPATDTVAHVTLVDTVTTLTNSPDVPTESEIAAQVRINLAPELASITAMEERLEEQVPTGPVVVIPAPPPGQTAAWTLCLDPSGQPDPGARVYLQMTTAGSGTGVALDPGMLEGIADADGIATVLIPRRAGPQYQVWRGQGARVTVTGVDAETLPLPILMGSP